MNAETSSALILDVFIMSSVAVSVFESNRETANAVTILEAFIVINSVRAGMIINVLSFDQGAELRKVKSAISFHLKFLDVADDLDDINVYENQLLVPVAPRVEASIITNSHHAGNGSKS